MHVVVWTLDDRRYATSSAAVVEVIPVVQSRPIAGSEPWLRGLFDYRGELLPLVDSARLFEREAGDYRMSSRILVLQVDSIEGDGQRRLGLLVERVLGTERLEFAEAAGPSPGLDFLGPVAMTAAGTVQLMAPARLPEPQR